MDGGIRTGNDIFKAVALGADSVLIGRPVVYGLAIGVRVNNILRLLGSFKSLESNKTSRILGKAGAQARYKAAQVSQSCLRVSLGESVSLRREFDYAMILSGCSTIQEMRGNKQMVVHESFYSKF